MDKIYDFGSLGKWSEATLLANAQEYTLKGKLFQITNLRIENEANGETHECWTKIDELRDTKIDFGGVIHKHRTVGEILDVINQIRSLEKKRSEIRKDYEKYQEVMKKLLKKFKRHSRQR